MTLQTFESHAVGAAAPSSPLQLKRILVAVDFSPASKNAFRHAVTLAKNARSELIVLYVVPPAPTRAFTAMDDFPPNGETELSTPEQNLRRLTRSARTEGIENAKAAVRIGVPSHEIVQAAKESDADLIVIATHGYTGWRHFCIGSTAERVVRSATCPVLVVHEKEYEF
jgi:universal stress protein A